MTDQDGSTSTLHLGHSALESHQDPAQVSCWGRGAPQSWEQLGTEGPRWGDLCGETQPRP